jgi:hypothetical protein
VEWGDTYGVYCIGRAGERAARLQKKAGFARISNIAGRLDWWE